ncbi:MAG: HemK2/MTQ2 family protein methyltransferase [Candidatus Micrarchaeaceae archaeon]|jgi:release factor glutamine methyltransferase
MLYDEVRSTLKITHKSVYKPLEDSRMLANAVEKYAFGKFLDLGTGTGIQGIVAAKKKCDVTFADINPESIECAKLNAKANSVKGKFIVSDLFSNIKGKFNVIAIDPPYLVSKPLDENPKRNYSFDGGVNGREIIDGFLKNYKKHILKDHIILMTESYWNNVNDDIKRLKAEVVGKRHYPLLGDCAVLKFK